MATTARFSGQWSADLVLDYSHFEWLGLVFEEYSYDGTEHTFRKSDDFRMRSFSIKAEKKNRMVRGSKDETHTLLGCIVTSFGLTYESSGSSAVKVSLRGLYVDETLSLDNIDTLKVKKAGLANNPDQGGQARSPVEWGCLCTYDGTNYTPIANTEKVSFTMSNAVTTIPNCGSRFDGDYYEKNVGTTTVNTTVYSRNPEVWYQKIYSGGFRSTDLAPLGKALRPIDALYVISRDKDNRDVGKIGEAENYVRLQLNKVYVKSMAQSYSATSAIVDSPSLDVRSLELHIKSKALNSKIVYNDANSVITNPVTLTFRDNSGDSTVSGIPSPIIVQSGSTVSVPVAMVTRKGHQFAGWDKSGTTIQNGQDIVITADTVITAKWTPNNYSIEFNANGGTGTMASLAMTYGTAKALTQNAYALSGKTFRGWSAVPNGAVSFSDKQSVSNLTDVNGGVVTLYAVWQ